MSANNLFLSSHHSDDLHVSGIEMIQEKMLRRDNPQKPVDLINFLKNKNTFVHDPSFNRSEKNEIARSYVSKQHDLLITTYTKRNTSSSIINCEVFDFKTEKRGLVFANMYNRLEMIVMDFNDTRMEVINGLVKSDYIQEPDLRQAKHIFTNLGKSGIKSPRAA